MNWGRDTRRLEKALATIEGRIDASLELLQVTEEYAGVKHDLTNALIELDRVKENHEREKRDIEHKLGLHKIQVEQEKAASIQEAKLTVREEALAAQKDRFTEEMKFIRDRMEDEIQSQRELMDQILSRLPHFTHSRVEHVGVDPHPPAKIQLELGDAS